MPRILVAVSSSGRAPRKPGDGRDEPGGEPDDGRGEPDPAVIAEAARVLRGGGLVAFPTETVYGLGARALDPVAIDRVFAAKGRPKRHPLIAHVEGEDEARALAGAWSPLASRLARAFWPGPLTLVVPRAAHVPAAIAGGGDTIAVRAPAHPVARAILAALGEPIAAPSANRYQSLSPVLAAHVAKSLGDAVDLIIDGGPTTDGIESTVVDVRGDEVVVLRPGAIDLAMLRAIAPARHRDADAPSPAEDAARASPGMDARHYAPRATLIVAETAAAARQIADGAIARGAKSVALVLREGSASTDACEADRAGAAGTDAHDAIAARVSAHVLPADPKGYERRLFATLHAIDDADCDVVVVEAVPDGDAWRAVRDRLDRARAKPA